MLHYKATLKEHRVAVMNYEKQISEMKEGYESEIIGYEKIVQNKTKQQEILQEQLRETLTYYKAESDKLQTRISDLENSNFQLQD